MTKTAQAMVAAATAALLSGCGGSPADGNQQLSKPAEGMKARIDAGASCAELFEERARVDPNSPDMPTINANLREIGCYSRSSTRTK